MSLHLGVNIDHVATLRQARYAVTPDSENAEPDVIAATRLGVEAVELHTGAFANARAGAPQERELKYLIEAASFAHEQRLKVHAGHGINYTNIKQALQIPHLSELNIGHSIISRAVFV